LLQFLPFIDILLFLSLLVVVYVTQWLAYLTLKCTPAWLHRWTTYYLGPPVKPRTASVCTFYQ